MSGCSGEGDCDCDSDCDEVFQKPLVSTYTQDQYSQLAFDKSSGLFDEGSVDKEHSLFCPQAKECSCPRKKSVMPSHLKEARPVCIENHAVESLKFALKSKDFVAPKTPLCKQTVELLSGRNLTVENIWDCVLMPAQSLGYAVINKWLDNQLVPEADCTHLNKAEFLADFMAQAAVGLSLDEGPTRCRDSYRVGRCLFIYLRCLADTKYFFIDIIECSKKERESRVGYVVSFPTYEEAIIFDSWENLKIFIDTYLLAQLVFCIDFYLFEKNDD